MNRTHRTKVLSWEVQKSILPILGHLEVTFTVPGSEKVAPVGKSLPLLRQEVSVVCSEFESWEAGLPREQPIREADTKDMAEGLEVLCEEVLLAVQNLIRMERKNGWKEEKEEKKEENVEAKEEEDEEINLTTGHITLHLHKELRAELKELRLAKVCMMYLQCRIGSFLEYRTGYCFIIVRSICFQYTTWIVL